MNDYAFGKKILELRTQMKLTQTELAELIGVTDKAVSKWETGKSKPTTNVIRKFSEVLVHRYVCCSGGYSEEWIDKEDIPRLKKKYK